MLRFGQTGLAVFAVAVAAPFALPGGHEAAGAAASAAGAASAAMTRVCLAPISATGHAKLQGVASNRARLNWNQVRPANHTTFANSDGQDTTCRHDGRPPALRWWTCVATAQPCRDDGNGSSGSSTGSSSSGGSPLCQASLAVEGDRALLQPGAENNAVQAWQDAAANSHGPAYRAWGLAQGRNLSCGHNGLGPMQRRWRCTATGSPCRTP